MKSFEVKYRAWADRQGVDAEEDEDEDEDEHIPLAYLDGTHAREAILTESLRDDANEDDL